MQIIKIDGVVLESIHACIPDNEINNLEACRALYRDEAIDIVKGTGIERKYIVSKGISSLDLSVAAAKVMFKTRPESVAEIKAVICVTFTPDQLMPCNAIAAQHRLGLASNCLAFDINLACSGYGYGLWLAATMARQLGGKILLLDGDVQSAFMSPYDKGTMPVLSDAGTATLVAPRDGAKSWYFSFMTDGSKRDILEIPAGGSRRPVTEEDLKFVDMPDGGKRRPIDIKMDGFEIFKFVAQTVSKFLIGFLKNIAISADSIDVFVPHQANVYMIKQLAKKIGIQTDRVWISGDKYGNSASASIPVTIASVAGSALKSGETRLLLSGFGAGLSVSAAIIHINDSIDCGIYRFVKE